MSTQFGSPFIINKKSKFLTLIIKKPTNLASTLIGIGVAFVFLSAIASQVAYCAQQPKKQQQQQQQQQGVATVSQQVTGLHLFVVFPGAEEEVSAIGSLAGFSKVSTRVFDHGKGVTAMHTYRVSFGSVAVADGGSHLESTPLGIAKIYAALRQERFNERSLLRRRFVVIVGRGAAIAKAIVAVKAWAAAEQLTPPPATLVYDLDFFNHADIATAVFQLNQDRRQLVAPLLASTVLHKSHPKGGVVVLIHDVRLVADQLYIAAHSLFNTLVLVTADQSEDVVAANMRNEIAPLLGTVLMAQTIPAATFVIHSADSAGVAKIFAAASRNNLVGAKFVWIVTDRNVLVATNAMTNESHLRPPVKASLLPAHLIALHADRKQLFEVALARLLNGMAKSLAVTLARVKATSPGRWHQLMASTPSPPARRPPQLLDVSFGHLFESDGSVISGGRRGGSRYYSDDARYIVALEVSLDRQTGRLREERVLLRSASTMHHNDSTTVASSSSAFWSASRSSSSSADGDDGDDDGSNSQSSDASEMLIADGAATDDVIPHLLQVYISLGPPFLFEKPFSPLTGDCQGTSEVVCDRIVPGFYEQLASPTLSPLCCSGLVPDLVRTLSKDLKVNARIVISATGGHNTNVTVALDMLNRRAVDIAFTTDPFIGKHSTSRYYITDPFFTSTYAMLVAIRRKEPSLFAFLSPFPFSVWTGIIFMLAPLSALAISQFEWHSPFGLNPWGRKRSTNYTLGSALNMVYALLFGHTIKTKCPKAWPSKWTQNFWAGFAIFVIASYTGNLASFLAKRHESTEFESIYDLAESKGAKVGVVRDDPIIDWLRLADSGLAAKLTAVNTLEEAVKKLRQYDFDVVIGELATLRYWQLTDDANTCSTKLLPRTFADREMAPTMLVDSQFRATIAGKMREYKSTGEFEQLVGKNRFVSLSLQGGATACGDQPDASGGEWARQAGDTQLTLRHANGLFLAMVAAIIGCCFILVAEHIAYYCLVPKLRSKKRTSFWRGFMLMYFSQRLYRIINSEEVLRPSQVLREMLNVVKKLEFSRIFQKSARKKRFRKITIAEFVQQVKEEKEKSLPNIVVQTKGIQRAKKAWKSPSRMKSSASPSLEEASLGSFELRYKSGSFENPKSGSMELMTQNQSSHVRVLSVQYGGKRASRTNTDPGRWPALFKGKRPPVSGGGAGGIPLTVPEANERWNTLVDSRGRTSPSSSSSTSSTPQRKVRLPSAQRLLGASAHRPMTLAPIADDGVTPAMRWRRVRLHVLTPLGRAKARGELPPDAGGLEVQRLLSGKFRLERAVTDLLRQLEEVKRERDRLLLIQELPESSRV